MKILSNNEALENVSLQMDEALRSNRVVVGVQITTIFYDPSLPSTCSTKNTKEQTCQNLRTSLWNLNRCVLFDTELFRGTHPDGREGCGHLERCSKCAELVSDALG